jgi:hypothetical protein
VILQIDVTVTGPDQVLTGSATDIVNDPPEQAAPAAPAPAPAASTELAARRARQRAQARRRTR